MLGTTAPTASFASRNTGPIGASGSWNLAFVDDFDGPLNTMVWTPFWFQDNNAGSIMNNVKTASSNVQVANSELILTLSDADTGAMVSSNPGDFVPGHTGFTFTHGFVEAKIWFPGNPDGSYINWPAFWTNGQVWPQDGEIDIAEVAGWADGNRTLTTNYHYGPSVAGHLSKGWTPAGDYTNGWHVFGVNRKADSNDIYYDGQLVASYTSDDGNAPHYLMFNIGTSTSADQRLGAAGQLRVDWVKHWVPA